MLWGLIHAVMFSLEAATRGARDRFADFVGLSKLPLLRGAIQIGFTFSIVSVSWIFFRAATVSDAWTILLALPTGWGALLSAGGRAQSFAGLGAFTGGSTSLLVSVLLWRSAQLVRERRDVGGLIDGLPGWLRWLGYSALVWWIFLFGNFGRLPFIYFRF